ncbi:MAG: YaiO family outer membrane beta-barrel protein, partial [Flavobacteriaceae bacterium]|nr:YaiO family outer membrane beta-barrel protein [Flavobacteriaceae bacterium]
MKKNISTFVLTLLFTSIVFAQDPVYQGNPDKSFANARELAFNSEREKAQDTLRFILTKYPNYHDIRAFLASTYSWDKKYSEARVEFDYVLEKAPKRKDTWVAAINNELWGENPQKALDKVHTALSHFENDEDLLYLKAKSLENNRREVDALLILDDLTKLNPNNQKAQDYKTSLTHKISFNSVGISTSLNLYSDIFDPAQEYAVKIGRKTKYGSIIGRVNINNRFNTTGAQFEIDAYPKIAKGVYAYLNFGYSNTKLFPDYRHGGELHFSLPYSLESSIGYRALHFGTSTTKMFTGSLGLYKGNYYFSFRPYFTPNDAGTSKSGTISIRKYKSDEDNYLGVSFGMGYSPEIDDFDPLLNQDIIIDLKSQSGNISYNFTSKSKKHAWGTKFGLTHREKSFSPGSYIWIYSLGLNWEVRYR